MPALPPTGPEIDRLKQALLEAFTLDGLRQLLRIQLDVDLGHLVPTLGQNGDQNSGQIAYNLVRTYAAKPGGLALLLRAALAENPNNPALQEVAAGFAGREFGILPLPKELTAHGDTISATIGENVRNVLVGKNANQVIIEGGVTITGGDFIGRDQINYFISGDPPPLYVNVPALPQHFLGRDDLLGELVERLCAGQTTALSADGLPGVGKTTLAIALARHPDVLAHFADGVLWAGVGRSPDVASIQATWAEHMGAQITDIGDPATRLARINDAIGLRRLLIVLDDAWQAEPLDYLRTTGPNVVQILTTRDRAIARRFAGANQEVAVPVLAEAPSQTLLRTLAPEAWTADPAAAARLADQVGGLPLALELLGGYLAEPERILFPELSEAAFAELADTATRLALAQVRLGSVTGERQTLAETIALSLDELAKIRPEAVDAFYALGAFAPKPARFDLEAAMAVTEAGAATLALLIARSLLEQEGGAPALHQMLSDVARSQTPPEAVARHQRHYLALVEADNEDWQRIEPIYSQIAFAWDQAKALPPAGHSLADFVRLLSTFQGRRGLWKDKLAWSKEALAEARASEDVATENAMLVNIGYAYDALGDKQQALDLYNQALSLSRQTSDLAGQAATLNNIGRIHDVRGDKREALDFYIPALELLRKTGDKAHEATTLNNIGSAYASLKDKHQALKYFNQALPLRRQVGDVSGEAITLTNMGYIYDALGDKQQALDRYLQALPLQRQVGDLSGQATTLSNIGAVYSALDDKQQALDFFYQALPLRQQVGDLSGQATTLNNIGMVYSDLDDQQQALDFFYQALPLRRQVGDRWGESVTCYNIGLAHHSLGNFAQAITFVEKAVALDEAIGHPDLASNTATLAQLRAQLSGNDPPPQR